MVTEEVVQEALKQVYDPELGMDIINLGLVYNIEVKDEGKEVRIEMTLTTMGCPIFDQVKAQVEAILHELGVEKVDVELVWSPPWTPARMSEEARMMMRYLF
jgi:metal-sulfur cluster biosynthetic enzyme